MTDGSCLSCISASEHIYKDIILVTCLSSNKRLTYNSLKCFYSEIIIYSALIYRYISLSRDKIYSCNGLLSSACSVISLCNFSFLCSQCFSLLLEFQFLWFLCCVIVIRSSINKKFIEHLFSERSFREHSLDCNFNDLFRLLCHLF